ncbi:MAG TPA: AGE family epimerase/isomerase [Opitutaceae bacterium]|jgi:mannobiose 2-epimerase
MPAPANAPQLTDYIRRIEDDLRSNILPFWATRVVDPATGGFVGSVSNDLSVDRGAERGALLTSRILWTFSAAYQRYGDAGHLRVAEHAYGDLMGHFKDARNGGFWWSVSGEGKVLRDRKQIYGQAFAVYALSEYHAATGLREPLDEAVATYRLIERHALAPHGGYLEAFGAAWEPIDDMRLSEVDLNEPKSQNTHLHVMEAYTRLLSLWPDAGLKARLGDIVGIMLGRIVDPATAHLWLFFAEDWTPRSDRVSYGHDIEAAWLLTWAADVLGDPALTRATRALALRIADVTLAEGVDSDGGVYNQGSPAGLTDTNKEWWPQAEAVVGFLNAHAIAGGSRYLGAALRTWDFIEARLIDRSNGEWFRGVDRGGRLLQGELKVSFWKCPYHNGRTALEATRRLSLILHPESSPQP